MKYISQEEAKRAIRKAFKDLPLRIEINTIINSMPTVDLITCGECVYWKGKDFYYCTIDDRTTEPSDFCSFGERKE